MSNDRAVVWQDGEEWFMARWARMAEQGEATWNINGRLDTRTSGVVFREGGPIFRRKAKQHTIGGILYASGCQSGPIHAP